jgi:hypothetical protein
MRKPLLGMMLAAATWLTVGCDEPPRARTLPGDDASETSEDFRQRRRSGSDLASEPGDSTASDAEREERRRPDYDSRQSSAAEDAEDARDAEADRPTSARD